MKLLATAMGVCAILAGFLAWRVIEGVVTSQVAEAGTGSGQLGVAVQSPADVSDRAAATTKPVNTVEPVKAADVAADIAWVESPVARPSSAEVRWAKPTTTVGSAARLSAAREALARDPESPAALTDAIHAARDAQSWDVLADLLGRALSQAPEAVALRAEYAGALLRLRRWVLALPELREVLSREPENAEALFNLAIAQQALGSLGDACRTWTRVLELRPADAEALARRGEVRLDLEQWALAEADLRACLALEPDAIDAALNLSLAQARQGELAAACATLDPLVESHPKHIALLNRLAGLCWRRAQVGEPTLAKRAALLLERSLAAADQPEVAALLRQVRAARPGVGGADRLP